MESQWLLYSLVYGFIIFLTFGVVSLIKGYLKIKYIDLDDHYTILGNNRRWFILFKYISLVGLFGLAVVFWISPYVFNNFWSFLGIVIYLTLSGSETDSSDVDFIIVNSSIIRDPIIMISILWGLIYLLFLWMAMYSPRFKERISRLPIIFFPIKSIGASIEYIREVEHIMLYSKDSDIDPENFSFWAHIGNSYYYFAKTMKLFGGTMLFTTFIVGLRIFFATQLEAYFNLSSIDVSETVIVLIITLLGQILAYNVTSSTYSLISEGQIIVEEISFSFSPILIIFAWIVNYILNLNLSIFEISVAVFMAIATLISIQTLAQMFMWILGHIMFSIIYFMIAGIIYNIFLYFNLILYVFWYGLIAIYIPIHIGYNARKNWMKKSNQEKSTVVT